MEMDYYVQQDKMYVKIKWLLISYFDKQLQVLLYTNIDEKRHIDCWSLKTSNVGFIIDVEKTLYNSILTYTGLEKYYKNEYKSIRLNNNNNLSIQLRYIVSTPVKKIENRKLDESGGFWFPIHKLPQNLNQYDRDFILSVRENLKEQVNYLPILPFLLPDKFSFQELQGLFEAIYMMKFDHSNFRKKIEKIEILISLNEKAKNAKRKPPELYKIKKEVYWQRLDFKGIFKLPKRN